MLVKNEPESWLEDHAPGYFDLQCKVREEVKHFFLLWSLFEGGKLDGNASVVCIERYVASNRVELSEEKELIDGAFAFFKERYFIDGEFSGLQMLDRKPDKRIKYLANEIFTNPCSSSVEKTLLLLLIFYRFRNNLFHGYKWTFAMQNQEQNFTFANNVLMSLME